MTVTARGNQADYAGRRYDVLAFRGARAEGDVLLDASLFDDEEAGVICVGVQKLAQRFVLEFLTVLGSIPYDASRGCRFPLLLMQGALRTETDVFTEFDFSMIDVSRNLRGEEADDMPDDERFAGAELENVSILPGFLQLTTRVLSLAGTSRKVILPLDTAL